MDISFYVKKKDYDKVINNMPSYNALWFSDKKQADTIPFFGLRKINQSPNKIILFFDLLKYNYSISLGFTIIFMPIFIVALLKKVLKNKDYQLDDIYNIKGNKYINQIFILFLFLAILRFLI